MELFRKSLLSFHKRRHHVRLIFFACLILLSSSSLFLYYSNIAQSEAILIKQTLTRQVLVEKISQLVITQFFTIAERELHALATSSNIQEQTPGWTQKRLDDLIKTTPDKKSPLMALYFLNQQGVVTAISATNNAKSTLGSSFADREYFTWTKDPAHKDQVYVSAPFVSRAQSNKGQTIIMVTTPVYSESGKYQGTLGAVISFDAFVNRFIGPLTTSHPEIWFLDKNGVLLAGGDGDEKISMNIVDYAHKTMWDGSGDFANQLKKALSSDQSILHFNYKRVNGNVSEMYGTSIKIKIYNQSFYLVIFNTKDQIFAPITMPFGMSFVPYLTILATLIAGLIFVTLVRLTNRDGFMEGYERAKEKYNSKKTTN